MTDTSLPFARIPRRIAWRGIGRYLLAMTRVARQRRDLASLSDHRLRDIGISRELTLWESQRFAWDLPASQWDDRER